MRRPGRLRKSSRVPDVADVRNTIFSTATFKNSLDLLMELFGIMDSYFRAFQVPAGSVAWVVGFEPLVAGLAGGDNVLGLGPKDTGFSKLLLCVRQS